MGKKIREFFRAGKRTIPLWHYPRTKLSSCWSHHGRELSNLLQDLLFVLQLVADLLLAFDLLWIVVQFVVQQAVQQIHNKSKQWSPTLTRGVARRCGCNSSHAFSDHYKPQTSCTEARKVGQADKSTPTKHDLQVRAQCACAYTAYTWRVVVALRLTQRARRGASICTTLIGVERTWQMRRLQHRAFLVCSSTQKCSSKDICAVLLSKMCSWQMDNISKNSVNF